MAKRALIVGAGSGLSAALARCFTNAGLSVGLVARDIDKLGTLGDWRFAADAADVSQVRALFRAVDQDIGPIDVVVYNPSRRLRGPTLDLEPAAVQAALQTTAFGGFLVAQESLRRMAPRGSGTLLFTGASASVKGYPGSAPFAMGKFALRGLAESLAREFQPQGIHVAHVVIDGAIGVADTVAPGADVMLDPDAIAQTYLQLIEQPRSAWTFELALRPWQEPF